MECKIPKSQPGSVCSIVANNDQLIMTSFLYARTALILALTAIMGSLSAGWNQYPVLYRILSGHPCIWVFYLTKYTFFNHINLNAPCLSTAPLLTTPCLSTAPLLTAPHPSSAPLLTAPCLSTVPLLTAPYLSIVHLLTAPISLSSPFIDCPLSLDGPFIDCSLLPLY